MFCKNEYFFNRKRKKSIQLAETFFNLIIITDRN